MQRIEGTVATNSRPSGLERVHAQDSVRQEGWPVSRRNFLASALAVTGLGTARSLFRYEDYLFAANDARQLAIKKPVAVVEAPFNLGLRPPRPGHEPGVRYLAEKLTGYGLPKALAL